jgi:hypothetical protein
MTKSLVMALVLAAMPCAQAQETTTFTARFTELLRSIDNGHSPSPEEIIAANDQVQPDPADLHTAMPLIVKALGSSDKDVRAYALTTLVGLEVSPAAAAAAEPPASDKPTADKPPTPVAKTAGPAPVLPSSYKGAVARELATAIPAIAARLTDESQTNGVEAAEVLGGFGPNPPAAVYVPLLAYLKLDSAIGPVGQAVVEALLGLGPVPNEVAAGVSRFLRRTDQTAESRSDLIEAVTTRPNQSALINKTLLNYMDSDDPGVRARLILSLPQLELAPEVFADTRARVAALAANEQENLQVVTAAKTVTACWTEAKMTSACPAY